MDLKPKPKLNGGGGFVGIFYPAILAVRWIGTWVIWKCALWNNIKFQWCLYTLFVQPMHPIWVSLQQTFICLTKQNNPHMTCTKTLECIYMYYFGRCFYLKWLTTVQGNLTNQINTVLVLVLSSKWRGYDPGVNVRGGTVRIPSHMVHGANSKWKWSSLSPWSGDLSEQGTCVQLFCRLKSTWQRDWSNFLIIFSWDAPVTTQHSVCQQNLWRTPA